MSLLVFNDNKTAMKENYIYHCHGIYFNGTNASINSNLTDMKKRRKGEVLINGGFPLSYV